MSHLIRTALECVFLYKTNQQFKGGQFHLIEFRTNLFLTRKNCSTVYMLCLRRVVRVSSKRIFYYCITSFWNFLAALSSCSRQMDHEEFVSCSGVFTSCISRTTAARC